MNKLTDLSAETLEKEARGLCKGISCRFFLSIQKFIFIYAIVYFVYAKHVCNTEYFFKD